MPLILTLCVKSGVTTERGHLAEFRENKEFRKEDKFRVFTLKKVREKIRVFPEFFRG
jgi:hypothetical protein